MSAEVLVAVEVQTQTLHAGSDLDRSLWLYFLPLLQLTEEEDLEILWQISRSWTTESVRFLVYLLDLFTYLAS